MHCILRYFEIFYSLHICGICHIHTTHCIKQHNYKQKSCNIFFIYIVTFTYNIILYFSYHFDLLKINIHFFLKSTHFSVCKTNVTITHITNDKIFVNVQIVFYVPFRNTAFRCTLVHSQCSLLLMSYKNLLC